MALRTTWRSTLAALLLAIAVAPRVAHAFPESTETQGEIEADLNGVWLVVHHLTFDRPTPAPTPGEPPVGTKRTFNVLNLVKMVHLKKEEAEKARAAKGEALQASVAKAEAIAAKENTKLAAVETPEGKIEGGARVIVPEIPRPPGFDRTAYEGDEVEVFLLDVTLPKTIDDALQKAQRAETPFEPTAEQLALLGSSWESLAPRKDSEFSRIEWKVVAQKYFDQGMQRDASLRSAAAAISGTQELIPRPGQASKNIVIYGVEKHDAKTLSGRHVRAIMANAPFPIPIEMKGTFVMFKIAGLPGRKAKTSAEGAKDEPS